jgi:hypothetical protein
LLYILIITLFVMLIAVYMINQVKLPPEYWYALSIGAQKMGYKSRQDLVEKLLKTWVDAQPGFLDEGLEKSQLEARVRDNIRKQIYDDPTKLIVSIPYLNNAFEKPMKRYRYKFKDGRTEELVVEYPGDGIIKLTGKALSVEEQEDIFDGPPEFLGDVKPPRIR